MHAATRLRVPRSSPAPRLTLDPAQRPRAARQDILSAIQVGGRPDCGSDSRAVSLLPRIHLCVLPLRRLVASHADVLRAQRRPMPSGRIVITGPSRTGDIEQRLTLGAHGPVALHVIVTR